MRADKAKVERLLKTARGQIDGILKMIDDDKYCIDIINQILASEAVLRRATKEVMHGHIEGCVQDAFDSDEATRQEKISEITAIFDKINK